MRGQGEGEGPLNLKSLRVSKEVSTLGEQGEEGMKRRGCEGDQRGGNGPDHSCRPSSRVKIKCVYNTPELSSTRVDHSV